MQHPVKHLALIIAALFSGHALAQESTAVGRIVVEGDAPGNGLMIQEETPKARSSVTRATLEQKSPLNNVFQAIDLLPGINTYSYDAAGLFGGGLRMRGFNSDQIGAVDGVPVNDAGNFAVYPSELNDIENLQEIFITQGSTDTDAPHIGASGGNIGLVTSNPLDQARLRAQQTSTRPLNLCVCRHRHLAGIFKPSFPTQVGGRQMERRRQCISNTSISGISTSRRATASPRACYGTKCSTTTCAPSPWRRSIHSAATPISAPSRPSIWSA
jgi:hypothetical protein